MAARALRLYAGPKARAHIERHGLRPQDVGVVPGAAGGPKGLVLGPLDRFIFGEWLSQSTQPVHLVGASIGAWRMATACLRATPRESLHIPAPSQSADSSCGSDPPSHP